LLAALNKVTLISDETEVVEVKISRSNASRGRVRVIASDGEDLVIDLPRGENINDGDVFRSSSGSYYKVSIEPERVVKVTLDSSHNGASLENAMKLGYNFGNRHLEMLVIHRRKSTTAVISNPNALYRLSQTGQPFPHKTKRAFIQHLRFVLFRINHKNRMQGDKRKFVIQKAYGKTVYLTLPENFLL